MRWIPRIREGYAPGSIISQALYGLAVQSSLVASARNLEGLILQPGNDDSDRGSLAVMRLEATLFDTLDQLHGLIGEMRGHSPGMKAVLPRDNVSKLSSSRLRAWDSELQSPFRRCPSIDESALKGFESAAALEALYKWKTRKSLTQIERRFSRRTADTLANGA